MNKIIELAKFASGYTPKVHIDQLLSVELVSYSGRDALVAMAARVSTQREDMDDDYDGLIQYLAREGHTSPFEHVVFTFLVDAPLFVRDQWFRHRTQSYNARSLRYSGLEEDRPLEELFYFPGPERPLENLGSGAHPKFENAPSKKLYESTIEQMKASCQGSLDTYRSLLAEGVASEVARGVLPANTMTRFFATANLKNWADFYRKRLAPNAQVEIRDCALGVGSLISSVVPLSWGELTK